MSEQEFKMPFGKHKGTLVRELPGDYLKWLSTIELREPLASEVKKVMSWRPVSVPTPKGVGNTTPSYRSTSTACPGPSPATFKGVSGGSPRSEVPKPRRQWIPRPEQEDLTPYYSTPGNDGIPY